MPFVKTARFIHGVVKFVSGNARETSTVEVVYELIHQFKKTVFMTIIVFAIKPVNLIAAHQLVMREQCIGSNACHEKLLFGKKRD